jgi:hypothetical protein
VTEEDDRFVARAIYVPPKDPKWEAIEIGEVHRRIRGALGDASDELLESLSIAVIMSIPPPSEIVKYLTDAVAALNGVWSIFDITLANRASLPIFGELREAVFDFIGLLQAIRDRGYRFCDHKMETLPDGSSQCRDCKSGWAPGQVPKEEPPGRLLTSRAHSPLVEGQRPPGKAEFFYLITRISRLHQPKRVEAMKLASKLIELFWHDGSGYETERQMETVYQDGKRSAEAKQLITAEDIENYAFWHTLGAHIIWVPYRAPAEPTK